MGTIRFKLDEVMEAVEMKPTLARKALTNLRFRQDFIQGIAEMLELPFIETPSPEGNVCYAGDINLRPEYRTSFSKSELLDLVLCQVIDDQVNLKEVEVLFPDNLKDFFSNAFRQKLAIIAQKKQLRKTNLDKRDALSRKVRQELSSSICKQLWDMIIRYNSRVIHSYLPMGSEVNVAPLLQTALENGIKVVVPKTLKKRQMQNLILQDLNDMEQGIFNTYHPRNAKEYNGNYDLIIVAGLAFDRRGFRVGYGGGYYDTFLATQTEAFKAGVCYPFQMIDQVPTEEHDIMLDCILSD